MHANAVYCAYYAVIVDRHPSVLGKRAENAELFTAAGASGSPFRLGGLGLWEELHSQAPFAVDT